MKLIKKMARAAPFIFLFPFFLVGLGFTYASINDISYRKGLIEVYENSDTIATATLFRINSIGGGSGRTYYLRYLYIDDEGKRYEGDYKPHALETWAEAEFYIGKTIEIKIYEGKSYPAEYGYPSHLGYQYVVAPLFFGMATLMAVLGVVRVRLLKAEGKMTAKIFLIGDMY